MSIKTIFLVFFVIFLCISSLIAFLLFGNSLALIFSLFQQEISEIKYDFNIHLSLFMIFLGVLCVYFLLKKKLWYEMVATILVSLLLSIAVGGKPGFAYSILFIVFSLASMFFIKQYMECKFLYLFSLNWFYLSFLITFVIFIWWHSLARTEFFTVWMALALGFFFNALIGFFCVKRIKKLIEVDRCAADVSVRL